MMKICVFSQTFSFIAVKSRQIRKKKNETEKANTPESFFVSLFDLLYLCRREGHEDVFSFPNQLSWCKDYPHGVQHILPPVGLLVKQVNEGARDWKAVCKLR